MGRYIKSGSVAGIPDSSQVTVCGQIYPRFNTAQFQYTCDPNECWPNRVIIDQPGSYTFTVPTGATCARAVLVGGGGKFGCKPTVCCIYGGAGGGYAEKFFAATAGTTMTFCVGSQQSNTTLSYPTASVTVTAGGAAFCTPGTASGGDWNSTGGCAGLAGAYCCCAANYCLSCVACCGYCIVIGCMPAYTDSGIYQCCALFLPGGGSAGSFAHTSGGAGGWICDDTSGYQASGGAGGGGGIGVIQRCVYHPANCNCICYNGLEAWGTCYPGTAQGGGGTKWHPCLWDMCSRWNYEGYCQSSWWRDGTGHPGGKDNQEGLGDFFWQWHSNCCSCWLPQGYQPSGSEPVRYTWHDIYDIVGTGGQGKNVGFNVVDGQSYTCWTGWGRYFPQSNLANNAGEGAGTGGVYYGPCDPGNFGASQMPTFIDFQMICCLGTTSRCCDAYKLRQRWFPQFVSCAGILGGAGGVSICNLASKAGFGGGAGGFKRFIVCVCYGGSFDCCAGAANTLLAFPPACLDYLTNNAGTGVAILYWK